MATLALTAALTFTPVAHDIQPPCPEGLTQTWGVCVTDMARRWIPEKYLVSPVKARPETGVERWRGLVETYWPPGLVEWALRIIDCESHGNPSAKNVRSSAAGLFQFLRSTWDRGPAQALGFGSYDSGAVYDPELNIRAAAWLYANWGGASQWSCRA